MATSQRSILRLYAIWGGLAVLTVSLAVSALIGWRIQIMMLQGTARMVATGMAGFVGEAYTEEQFSQRDPAARRRLDEIIRQRERHGTVLGLRVIAPDGAVVYDSAGRDAGAGGPLDARQTAALRGEVSYETAAAGGQGAPGTVLAVTGPVSITEGGKPIAIVEASRAVDPVAGGILGSIAASTGVIMLGGVATYLLVLFVLTRATAEMDASAQEVGILNHRLEGSMRDLEEHSLGTLQCLVAAVDAKDSYTARHSLAVTDYALVIGKRLGIGDGLEVLERASLLHDVGKIGVPESVLLKPGRLLEREAAEVRVHSEMGAQIIETVPFLRDVIPVIRSHHERWDGAGYPDGLSGPEIPMLARVLAAADALDAIVSDRPYRDAQSLEYARKEFALCAGTQFDPVVATAVIDAIDVGEIHPERHHVSSTLVREAS